MDGPRISVTTQYGALDVSIGAGPTSAPGHGYLGDHVWPSEAHAFGRSPDAAYLYAFVRSDDGQLTINGIPYTVTYGRFSLREPQGSEIGTDWREDYGSGPSLKRSDVMFGGEPTDGARKAWRETISPAIVAALRSEAGHAAAIEAEAIARAAFATDCKARADALRVEADRLERLAPMV